MIPCLVALGSNLGDRQSFLDAAIDACGSIPETECVAVSPIHTTRAIGGPPEQGEFLNAAVKLETRLDVGALFRQLQQIELRLGRARKERWSARTVDLDLLLFGQLICSTPDLIVPHPWLCLRRFVLEPAVAIAPDMVHPIVGWTIRQLYEHLRFAEKYVAITGVDRPLVSDIVHQLQRATGVDVEHDPLDEEASPTGGRSVRTAEKSLELLQRRIDRLQQRNCAKEADDSGRQAGAASVDCGRVANRWISDYWLDDALDVCLIGPPAVRCEAMRIWCESRGRVPTPAVVVIITSPTDGDAVTVRGNGPVMEQGLSVETIVKRASRPGRGPILVVDGRDRDRAVHDLIALFDSLS